MLCMTLVLTLHGQRKMKSSGSFNKRSKQADIFLQKQWWLGFKAGPNLSKASVETRHDVISPVDYDISEVAKSYENFRQIGTQAVFEVTFFIKGASFSFQPAYRTNRFVYTNHYEWVDPEQSANHLILDYEQDQRIAYLDLPLIIKYEFPVSELKPYAQAGIYSSRLLDASKSLRISGVDHASGGVNTFENEPIIVGARDLFAKYHWGILVGCGVNYNLGNVRLNIDVVIKTGMSNIADARNRYGSDRLSGVGDSLDDVKLTSASLSVGCLFPLRFLGSGFRSTVD